MCKKIPLHFFSIYYRRGPRACSDSVMDTLVVQWYSFEQVSVSTRDKVLPLNFIYLYYAFVLLIFKGLYKYSGSNSLFSGLLRHVVLPPARFGLHHDPPKR